MAHDQGGETPFRLLIESGSEIFYRLDLLPTRRFTYISPATERLLGYSPQEFYADPDLVYRIAHPDHRQDIADLASDHAGDRAVVYRAFHNDGRIVWLEERQVAQRDESGRVVAYEGIISDVTVRMELQESLRKQEDLLRLFAEHSPDIMFYQDLDLRYIWTVHPAPPFTEESVIGKTDWDLFPPEEARHLETVKRRMLEAGEGVRLEVPLTVAGEQHYAEAVYEPRRDDEGNVVGLMGYVRDITERKRLQAERERLLAEMESVFASQTNAVVVFDASGVVVRANAAAGRTMGVDPVGLSRRDIVSRFAFRHMDGTPMTAEELPSHLVMQGGPVADRTFVLTNAEGKDVVVQGSAAPLVVGGEVVGSVANWLDVTERHHLVEQLRSANQELLAARQESERRSAELDAVIESMALGVMIYDSAGMLVHSNTAAARVLGYVSDPSGASIAERARHFRVETAAGEPFPEDELPANRALRGETVEGVTMVINPPGGEPIWASGSAAPVYAPGGEFLGVVATLTDVTVLHKLQEERDDLIRALSHDLRSPLTAVLGYAQILVKHLESTGATEKWIDMARSIAVGAGRMNEMTSQMAEATRLEAGQLPLNKQPVDLSAFVPELLRRMESALEVERVDVAVPADLPRVHADPTQLERICLNLISNGLKYSRPGTKVVVSAARKNGVVMVTVADEGAGIPPDDLKRIFDRFYRGRKGSAKVEGVGLGLFVTRKLVEAHGGQVCADSRVGQGSRFYFTIPVVQKD